MHVFTSPCVRLAVRGIISRAGSMERLAGKNHLCYNRSRLDMDWLDIKELIWRFWSRRPF